MQPIEPRAKPFLNEIHDTISKGTWREYCAIGWNTLMQRSSFWERTMIKTATVAGGVFVAGFTAAACGFATLALVEAVGLMQQGSPASIGGHFGEWTALAFFATLVCKRLPDSLSQLGRYTKIKEVFAAYLERADISDEEKEKIYKEELRYLETQSKNLLFESSSFPDTHGLLLTRFTGGRLQADILLQQVYRDIEQALPISRKELLKIGWEKEWQIKGTWKMCAVAAGLASLGILFTGQYAFYVMGIYFAGVEANEAMAHQELPSIGGHCLEWFTEMLALADFSISMGSEFTNVGKAIHLIKLFDKKIACQEEEPLKKRLIQEKRRQFSIFSEGYFLRLPREYLFKVE